MTSLIFALLVFASASVNAAPGDIVKVKVCTSISTPELPVGAMHGVKSISFWIMDENKEILVKAEVPVKQCPGIDFLSLNGCAEIEVAEPKWGFRIDEDGSLLDKEDVLQSGGMSYLMNLEHSVSHPISCSERNK